MVIGNVPRQQEGGYFRAFPYSQEDATIAGVVEETKHLPTVGLH